ncbi:WYL domain-containing protein [Cupriavidus basilensis]|uniref:WYL domain-containing protein n=1 Tax=Cupriavidus basilensis TaxID=68895 RepID=UPI003A59870C
MQRRRGLGIAEGTQPRIETFRNHGAAGREGHDYISCALSSRRSFGGGDSTFPRERCLRCRAQPCHQGPSGVRGRVSTSLTFEPRRRFYIPGPAFKPRFASDDPHEYLALQLATSQIRSSAVVPLVGDRLPVQSLPTPAYGVARQSLSLVVQAIRSGIALEVVCYSMTTTEPVTRLIWPHALIHTGSWWHLRAFDSCSEEFRNFALQRIEQPQSPSGSVAPTQRPESAVAQWVGAGGNSPYCAERPPDKGGCPRFWHDVGRRPAPEAGQDQELPGRLFPDLLWAGPPECASAPACPDPAQPGRVEAVAPTFRSRVAAWIAWREAVAALIGNNRHAFPMQ